jgi:hypothetical protein
MSILDRYAGFENLELNGTGTEGEQTAAIVEDAVRAEVAEVQVELEQQGQEIEELKAAVEEQDEAVEEIQEVVEGMESLIGSGSFNSTAFATLYNRATKLNAKLGGVSVDRMGVEALGDAGTAQIMARHGMESFMDTVKGWAKKAIEAIKHIFNAVINFFVGIFSSAEKLLRRHDQLVKRVDDAKAVKEKIKLGGWNALFDYEAHGLKEGTEGWSGTLAALAKFTNIGQNVTSVDLNSFNSAYGDLLLSVFKDAKKDLDASPKSQGDKKILIGQSAGVRIHAEMKEGPAKDLAEAAVLARSLKIHFGSGDVKKLTTGEVAPKVDKAGLKAILAEVRGTITQMREDKVSASFSKSVRDKVIGSLGVIKAEDKEKAKEVNEKIALVRAIYTSASSFTQALNKHNVRCASWTLDAVSAHV